MKTKCCLLVLVVFALLTGSAKTVALWPLDYDALNPDNGGRCAVSAANDLVAGYNNGGGMVTDGYGVGWNLPPNPDATASLRFTPVNRGYVRMVNTGKPYYHWSNPTAGRYVSPTANWTFEIFARLDKDPNYINLIASAFWNKDSDSDRWLFAMTPSNTTHGARFTCFSANPDIRTNSSDYIFLELSAAEYAALKTGFHHVALTHKVDADAGETTWKFYYDGVLRDTRTIASLPTSKDRSNSDNNHFQIGGRGAYSNYTFPGSLDYCRISDEVLEPAAFLNAGGAGTVLPTATDPTYVRWPLGRTPSGAIDGAPSVGSAYLGGGRPSASSGTGAQALVVVADEDQAFAGQIPNTATTIKSSSGNSGSLCFARGESGSAVEIPNLGAQLTLTNDFTVEGWWKMETRHLPPGNTWLRVCGALSSWGWTLQFRYNPASSEVPYFNLFAKANGQNVYAAAQKFTEAPLGTEDTWRHIALVHDCDEDQVTGQWRFYVNGVLSGTCAFTNVTGVTPAYPSSFWLNAASASSPQCSGAKFDHWRVSRAALSPDQFLCATTGARDATDVLAYWPMDAQRGVYLDGTDLTGNYTYETPVSTKYQAQTVTDAPPQADRPADFGAVGFYGTGGSASSLIDASTDTRTLFKSASWTFETWMKRTQSTTTWQLLFSVVRGNITYTPSTAQWSSWPAVDFSFSYRPANDLGFVIYSKYVVDNTTDKQFLGDDGQPILVPLNVWTHVALSYERDATTATYVLYTNGVRAAALSGSYIGKASSYAFVLGGRPQTSNSFYGYLADVRLSTRALVPGEFLCDKTATAPATIGFWPLDYADGALDFANRAGDLFSDLAGSAVTGLARGARGKVPNPDDSADYTGNRKLNFGAVQLASGGRLGTTLPTAAYLDGPFTAEGWINWAQTAGAAAETIVGNWNTTTNGGWRLLLDSSVTPARFRLQAQYGKSFTHVANGAFAADAASLKGDWHHLALTYDPTVATGVWSLYVDAHAAGAVTNFFRVTRGPLGPTTFRLGAASGEQNAVSFVGGLDMWRLSTGVRTPADFLYRPLRGLIINFR